MERIIDSIDSRTIEANGSNPIELNVSDRFYYVKSNIANVFIAPYKDGAIDGYAKYLFELKKGQLIMGVSSHDEYSLRLSGVIGTEIVECQLKNLLMCNLSESEETALKAMFKCSLEELCDSVFNRGKTLELMETMFPSIESASIEEMFSSINMLGDLAIKEAVGIYENSVSIDSHRLAEKYEKDHKLLDVFSKDVIYAVKNSKKETANLEELHDSPLLRACKVIGDVLDIEIHSPGEDIYEIASNNSFEIREIEIKEDIFNFDIGPVLGFLKEKNEPVAILSNGMGKYKIYNPSLKESMVMTKMQLQNSFAKTFMFYKQFPNEKIGPREFLKFAYDSVSKKDLMYIAIAGLIGGLLSTSVPIATGILFNNIIPEGNKFSLAGLGLVLLSITLSSVLFKYVQFLSMLRIEGKANGRLQGALWNRLMSLPVPFFGNFNPFELTLKVLGVDSMKIVISSAALTSILAVFFVLFNGILLVHFNASLALVVLVLALFSSAITLFLGFKDIKLMREIIKQEGKVSGITLETINGISKIFIAGAQKRAFSRWSKEFMIKSKIENQKARRLNSLNTFNQTYPIIVSLIIFFVALSGNSNDLSIGTFIGFYSAYVIFFGALISLSESLLAIVSIVPVYENLNDILKSLPEDSEEKIKCEGLKGDIEVRNLSFSYRDKGPTILNDISLNIKEGEYVAIVGFSGSGKSTLLRILLGFEKYNKGKVYYDKYDMQKTDIRSIRKQIGVVLQNGKLMSGSIYSNIIGANVRLTMDDAWEAAKKAGLFEDIQNLPMGMHTYVSEESAGLSGGQVQKILIARAVANNPKIIFFDEATSALDNKTQNVISKNMDFLSATKIVIAHRLSTIKKCDRIFVMDKGCIVEEGSYAELVKMDGRFTDLVKRQL